MKRNRIKKIVLPLISLGILLAVFGVQISLVTLDTHISYSGKQALAQGGSGSGDTSVGSGGGDTSVGSGSGDTSVGSGAGDGKLVSPTKDEYSTICKLLTKALELLAELAAIIGVLFIIWSGFQFIMAQGSPEKIKKAKDTFFMTVIGLAILLGASVITMLVFNTVMSVIAKNPDTTCGF